MESSRLSITVGVSYEAKIIDNNNKSNWHELIQSTLIDPMDRIKWINPTVSKKLTIFFLNDVTVLGGGGSMILRQQHKFLSYKKRDYGGREGSKNVKNHVTSYMDDPLFSLKRVS